eukprot:TRINITY_DN1162_c0_g1_i8.p2 TRINITY_DN1162_c0_g1~~TRINITY_DN1162_c0_g1_i8.p2  ORF type:complete len:497 (+),score=33.43 TRINITY_DN1162_c0_g1_i8:136-1626(+)
MLCWFLVLTLVLDLSSSSQLSAHMSEREYLKNFEPAKISNFTRLKNGRYELWEKISEGTYSVVWIAKDRQHKKFVAIKIPKWDDVELNCSFRLEINCLTRIKVQDEDDQFNCVRILDQFQICTQKFTYQIVVMELLGISLREVLQQKPPSICRKRGGMKMTLVQGATQRILTSLNYLHNDLGVIHTDLKPENIVLKQPWCKMGWQPTAEDFEVKLIDFSNFSHPACFQEDYIPQTPNYRSPEAVLGYEHQPSMDMWSVGCLTYELLTGESIFQVQEQCKNVIANLDHLSQMESLLGPLPKKIRNGGHHSKQYFVGNGKLRGGSSDSDGFSRMKYLITHRHASVFKHQQQMVAFYDFLCGCLTYDPAKRMTAKDALKHPFLTGKYNQKYRYIQQAQRQQEQKPNGFQNFINSIGCMFQKQQCPDNDSVQSTKSRRSSVLSCGSDMSYTLSQQKIQQKMLTRIDSFQRLSNQSSQASLPRLESFKQIPRVESFKQLQF